MTLRTRFAPSPTGYLHIGGARTALFAWLWAKQCQGEFALRIEDTDRERSTEASINAILEAMTWLGLDYDDGPVYQTDRFPRYQAVIEQLLADGKAYRCYCSKARLEKLREDQMANKEKPRYDGCCRDVQAAQSGDFVVRFKNPQTGEVTFDDFVRGPITVSNTELDDFIIARSDGTPTYNFTVVVDDWDMKMTHVLRGDDHINNTPRQINVFKALDAEPPKYGHLPMILGSDGKRLSKRHGAVSVMQYHEDGYFPEALLNYLVRLGWSHGDQEIFSREEMINAFDVAHISHSPAVFNPEKLLWVNAHYLKTLPLDRVANDLKPHYARMGVTVPEHFDLEAMVLVFRERANTLCELAESTVYCFNAPEHYDEKAAKKCLTHAASAPLETLLLKLRECAWTPEAIHQVMHETIESLGIGFGKLGQPLRLAITGVTQSPPMNDVMALLDRDEVCRRIESALAKI